jgi:hypothetical protein
MRERELGEILNEDERDVERGRTEWKKKGVGDRKKKISFWSLEQFFFQLGTRRHNNGRPAYSSNKIKFTKDLISFWF